VSRTFSIPPTPFSEVKDILRRAEKDMEDYEANTPPYSPQEYVNETSISLYEHLKTVHEAKEASLGE